MFEASYTDEKKKKKKEGFELETYDPRVLRKSVAFGCERARKIPISSFIEIGSI